MNTLNTNLSNGFMSSVSNTVKAAFASAFAVLVLTVVLLVSAAQLPIVQETVSTFRNNLAYAVMTAEHKADIENTYRENVYLKVQVAVLKERIDNALIPESTVSEVIHNRIVNPVKSLFSSAYDYSAPKVAFAVESVKSGAVSAKDSIADLF